MRFLKRKVSESVCKDSRSASAEQTAESLSCQQSINQLCQSHRQRMQGEDGVKFASRKFISSI